MTELERLMVLLARLQLEEIELLEEGDVENEIRALTETIAARCRSAVRYHDTIRGVDALERANARAEQREVDYLKARKDAGLI